MSKIFLFLVLIIILQLFESCLQNSSEEDKRDLLILITGKTQVPNDQYEKIVSKGPKNLLTINIDEIRDTKFPSVEKLSISVNAELEPSVIKFISRSTTGKLIIRDEFFIQLGNNNFIFDNINIETKTIIIYEWIETSNLTFNKTSIHAQDISIMVSSKLEIINTTQKYKKQDLDYSESPTDILWQYVRNSLKGKQNFMKKMFSCKENPKFDVLNEFSVAIGNWAIYNFKDLQKIGIVAKDIIVRDNSNINGNYIVVADSFKVQNGSYLNTHSSGSDYQDNLGRGDIVVSYDHECGFLGGAYAGWGGYGISDSITSTENCIMSNRYKFQIYAEKIIPTGFGSASTYINKNEIGVAEPYTYGTGLVLTNTLHLDKTSNIASGSINNGKTDPGQGYSGGSLFVYSRYWNVQGTISANGETNFKPNTSDLDNMKNGEGGGGHLSIYKSCWSSENCLQNKTSYQEAIKCIVDKANPTSKNNTLTQNKVYSNQELIDFGHKLVGDFGGACKCGDDKIYEVGCYDDNCEKIACLNGIALDKKMFFKGVWSGKAVHCGNVDSGKKEARKGYRELPEDFMKNTDLLKGEDGIVDHSPCPPGHQINQSNNGNCEECSIGYKKIGFFNSKCNECPFNNITRIYKEANNCDDFKCKEKKVLVFFLFNSKCRDLYGLQTQESIKYGKLILIIEGALLLLFLVIKIFRGKEIFENKKCCKKKHKKKISYSYSDEINTSKTADYNSNNIDLSQSQNDRGSSEIDSDNETTLIIQGSNNPKDSWYIELNFSKDFENEYLKSYYQPLPMENLRSYLKVINDKCKWKCGSKFMYFLASFLPWPQNDCFKKCLRKKIANKIKKTIKDINQTEQNKNDPINFRLWSNKSSNCAALILQINKLNFRLKEDDNDKAQLMFISGKMKDTSPLQIEYDRKALEQYLKSRKINEFNIKDGIKEFESLQELTNHYAYGMTVNQDSMNFVYEFFVFIDMVEIMNKFMLEKFNCRFVLTMIETVKRHWQQKKWVFSKITYIESRNYQELKEQQKDIKCSNKYDGKLDYKFYQFLFPVTPTIKESYTNRKSLKMTPNVLQFLKPSKTSMISNKLEEKSENKKLENYKTPLDMLALSNLDLEKDLTNNKKAQEDFLENEKRKHPCNEKLKYFLRSIVQFFYGYFSMDLPVIHKYLLYSFVQVLCFVNFIQGTIFLLFVIAIPKISINWFCILGAILLPFTFCNIYVLFYSFIWNLTLNRRICKELQKSQSKSFVNEIIWLCINTQLTTIKNSHIKDQEKNRDIWSIIVFLSFMQVIKLAQIFMLKFLVAYENKHHLKTAKKLITKNESPKEKKLTFSQELKIEDYQKDWKKKI